MAVQETPLKQTTYSYNSRLHAFDDDEAKLADAWFTRELKSVHEIIRNVRKNPNPVRVGIIDTGVDSQHPVIKAALLAQQIVDLKGFPQSLDPLNHPALDPYKDPRGHGTHGAHVLMQVAPHAKLYIARVEIEFRETLEHDDYGDVVEAISWAKTHLVDIISISWGMHRNIPSIEDALVAARKAGIIIFSSASNAGLREYITFPARLSQIVFCIGAATAEGKESKISPTQLGIEKYSALGEGVKGAKSTCLLPSSESKVTESSSALTSSDIKEQDLYIRKDGTSTATPIAAGIAVLLIEYTREIGNKYFSKKDERFENMRKLFIAMSAPSKGLAYRHLSLSHLFNKQESGNRLRNKFRNILSHDAGQKVHCFPTNGRP